MMVLKRPHEFGGDHEVVFVLPLFKDAILENKNISMDINHRVETRIISVLQIRKLRALILRPDQSPEMTAFIGDYAPDTLHLGAFEHRQLVGIVSVMHQSPKEVGDNDKIWLLRGVGTLSEVRGQGYGSALIRSACAFVAIERGTYLWCNARESAVGFYEKLGFEIRGNRFEIPITGPHYRMWREISVSDAAYIPF